VGRKFGEFTFLSTGEKVWQMNRFSQKVIIVSRNLDGFSLANHQIRQTFPVYGIRVTSIKLRNQDILKYYTSYIYVHFNFII